MSAHSVLYGTKLYITEDGYIMSGWTASRLSAMEFQGTFELEDTTVETVWRALSDPDLIRESLPGCEFLAEVEDRSVNFDDLRDGASEPTVSDEGDARTFEEGAIYAALIEISVGSITPSFETIVEIDRRDFPEMDASGEGSGGNSSFEFSSGMSLAETDSGVSVEWQAEAAVFGRIAQMGQRLINPVANRVVKRFFKRIQDRLSERSDPENITES